MAAVSACPELRSRGCLVNTAGWFPFLATQGTGKTGLLPKRVQFGQANVCLDSMLTIVCGLVAGIRLPYREGAFDLEEGLECGQM